MSDLPNIVGKYKLLNPDKVERALHGTLVSGNVMKGGIAKPDDTFDDKALLAEYDRIGGLITDSEGNKVKTGSFYDFKNRKPFETPKVILQFNINGEFVDVPEEKGTPQIVRAAKALEADKKERLAKKKKK